MKTAIETAPPAERFAVIEIRWSPVKCERLVMVYRDEQLLRELIAAPSIAEADFSSREAALECIRRSSDTDSGSTRAALDSRRETKVPRSLNRIRLGEARRIACVALQHALAAGVLIFYSKTIVGAAIRACVGA